MYTKQLLIGLLLSASALQAEVGLDWIGGDNSVHVEYNYYSLFNSSDSSQADVYEVVDYNGNTVDGGVAGMDAPDLVSLNGNTARYSDSDGNWLETTSNYDLSIWMPAISGYETQLFSVQICYFADLGDSEWRQNYDLGLELYYSDSSESGIISAISRSSLYDVETDMITESFTFTVENSADGIFIDIGADPGLSVNNPSYISWIEVDSASYDAVPEPSTYGILAGLAALALVAYRRRRTLR